jgi:hypothetical protein
MRPMMRFAAYALAASAGLCVVQTPTSTRAAGDAFAHVFSTPRYYSISASGSMKGLDGNKFCLGGDALRKMFEGFRALAKDPLIVAQANKGCTQKSAHDGVFVSIRRDCEQTAGAPFSSHMRVSGTIGELHQHFEIAINGLGPGGAGENDVGDSVWTYLGRCPPDVGPGGVLKPDGTVSYPLVELLRPAVESNQQPGAIKSK